MIFLMFMLETLVEQLKHRCNWHFTSGTVSTSPLTRIMVQVLGHAILQ